jgi:hypothetical protein
MIESFSKPEGWKDLPMYEKIKIYSKHLTPQHAQYVDKLEAKKIVKDLLGDDIEVARVIRVLEQWNSLQPEDLNPRYMIKSSHASGWNINVTPKTNYKQSFNQLCKWNKLYRPIEEIQYSFLTPRFYVEEKIDDPIVGNDGNCLVYMFRYTYGQLISIGVGCSINNRMNNNHYDTDWNLILHPELPFYIPKPTRLQDMLKMSKILAQEFEFVRIDFFYDKNNKIYFSEFTFTPKAGKHVFPMHLEMEYGKLWK